MGFDPDQFIAKRIAPQAPKPRRGFAGSADAEVMPVAVRPPSDVVGKVDLPGIAGSAAPEPFDPDNFIKKRIEPPPADTSAAGLTKRVFDATKETLLPTSADALKRLHDPRAGRFGVSKVLEEEGKRVGKSVRAVGDETADWWATSEFGQKFPLASAAIGTYVSTFSDVTSDTLTPSGQQEALGAEGMGVAGRAGGKALQAAAPAVKGLATDIGRRALGFQKSQLVSHKSPFETTRRIAQANRAAQAMLERKAIPMSGSPTVATENATRIMSEGGNKVRKAIKSVEDAGIRIDGGDLDNHLIDSIKPEFDDQFGVTETILKDIKSKTKDGTMSLSDLEDLRQRWGKFGYQDKTVGTTAADVYRNAWKAADNYLKKTIGTASDDLLKLYTTGKAEQEFAMTAQKGLGNKAAKEMGNDIVSLPALGAGIAFGDPSSALAMAAQVGGFEALKRRGAAPLARGIYGLGKFLESGAVPAFTPTLKRLLDVVPTAARSRLSPAFREALAAAEAR